MTNKKTKNKKMKNDMRQKRSNTKLPKTWEYWSQWEFEIKRITTIFLFYYQKHLSGKVFSHKNFI